MLRKGKMKVMSFAMAVLLFMGVFSFSPSLVRAAEDSDQIESLDFDFESLMLDVKRILQGFNQDFFNFESTKITEDDYGALATLAKNYVPFEYRSGDYYVIMAADDLITFMKEGFGIDLPKEDFGIFYEYDADNDTFVWPDSDGWFDIEVFKYNNIVSNDDGTITVDTDLYLVQTEHYYESLYDDIKKPIDEWDSRIYYAKIASPQVTIKQNSDYSFFPFELISIESDLINWIDTQGTYESEDGKVSLSYRVDEGVYWNAILMEATDIKTGKELKISGYLSGNTAMFYLDDVFMSATLVTVTPDGGLVVMDNPDAELTVAMSGTYKKVSSEIPLQIFHYDYDVHTIHGETKGEDMNVIGIYGIPKVLGLNDEELEAEVNKIIESRLIEGSEAFSENYWSFIDEIETEEDEEFKKELQEVSKRFSYESSIYYISSSEYYNVLAEFRTSYYGGAHNDLFIQTFNIDSEKKKLLTLDDIFDDEDWKEKIEEILTEMTKTDDYKDKVFSDLEEVEIVNDSDFYLMDGNLLIFFQPYAIGPFSSGFISFRIPFEDIKDMIRDEYLNAEYKDRYGSEMFYNTWMFSVDE